MFVLAGEEAGMYGQLGLVEIADELSSYATAFDPASVTCSDAAQVVRQASRVESIAAALKARAAARAAEGRGLHRSGDRSAAESLARETGSSVSSAKEAIETGKRLATQPEVAAAAARGELSSSQAALIAAAASRDPEATGDLLAEAKHGSLSNLKNACAEVLARVEDREQRRKRIHAGRGLRSYTDAEGYWHLHAKGNPEAGAQVMAAINPFAEQVFAEARQEGRREPTEAYAFDGLVRLAQSVLDDSAAPSTDGRPTDRRPTDDYTGEARPEHDGPDNAGGRPSDGSGTPPHPAPPAPSPAQPSPPPPEPAEPHTSEPPTPAATAPVRRRGAPVKLLVRIDYDAFLRGVPESDETCELVGYGPVAASAVRELIELGDPFVAAILTRGEALVGVAHLGRKPRAIQKSALEWLYPSCAAEGCAAQARLEVDHRIDWARTHFTMLDLLDRLCHRHHRLKTEEGWALVHGKGRRAFVPPGDPRHPRCSAGHASGSGPPGSGPPGSSTSSPGPEPPRPQDSPQYAPPRRPDPPRQPDPPSPRASPGREAA
jgi:hypothetical protein